MLDLSYDLGQNDGFNLGYQLGLSDGEQRILEYISNNDIWSLYSVQMQPEDFWHAPLVPKPEETEEIEKVKELNLAQQMIYASLPDSVRDNMAERLLNLVFDLSYAEGYNNSYRDLIDLFYQSENGFVLTTS